eukprot:GHVU01111114.1.p1 GENE.GHVU01111114.1~~GHVU01111114.1.p1  ORF type:complete len:389 (+),score=34.63 GHVU01111114.1:539-1705(+)
MGHSIAYAFIVVASCALLIVLLQSETSLPSMTFYNPSRSFLRLGPDTAWTATPSGNATLLAQLNNDSLPYWHQPHVDLLEHAKRVQSDMSQYDNGRDTRRRVRVPWRWHQFIKGVYYINLKHRRDRDELFINTMTEVGVPLNKMVRVDAPMMPNGREAAGASTAHYVIVDQLLQSLERDEGLRGERGREVNPEQYALICEDDFSFRLSRETVLDTLFKIMQADYNGNTTHFRFDVVQLATHNWDYKFKKQKVRGPVKNATAAGVDCFPCTRQHQELFLGSGIQDCCGKTWEELLGLVKVKRARTASGYIVKLERRILTMLRDAFLESAVHMNHHEQGEKWALDVLWNRIKRMPDVNWYITKPLLAGWYITFSDIEKVAMKYSPNKQLA